MATPSGSSGHSLSAGGPLMHPGLHDLGLMNMISARTMAFRPLLVPLRDGLRAGLSEESRAGEVEIILDGRSAGVLKRDERISVSLLWQEEFILTHSAHR